MGKHPTCDKLNEQNDEWNAIYPFIEWLHEHSMCLAVWRDPEMEYGAMDGTKGPIREVAPWLLEHPHPYGQPIDNLLYKYFDVDLHELERERRELLKNLGKKGG